MKGITRSALPALTAWSIAALAAPSAPPEFTQRGDGPQRQAGQTDTGDLKPCESCPSR